MLESIRADGGTQEYAVAPVFISSLLHLGTSLVMPNVASSFGDEFARLPSPKVF